MKIPKSLSPSAQAVLDATDYPEDWATRIRVAAALQAAAADQAYEVPAYIRGDDYWNYRLGVEAERRRILAIAAELEAQP